MPDTVVSPATKVPPAAVQEAKDARGNHAPDSDETLSKWQLSLKVLNEGHWDAARKFEKLNNRIGVAAALLSGVAGTAAFTSLQQSSGTSGRIIAGIFGGVAAVIASVQTSYKASERAEQHRAAGAKYGTLRHKLDSMVLEGLPKDEMQKKAISELIASWEELDKSTRPIPGRIYDRAKERARTRA